VKLLEAFIEQTIDMVDSMLNSASS